MSKYVDKAGLTHYTQKIKDGTIVAGKANSVPASGITGVIDLSHIPQGALERVVTVANQAARFALTTANVQLGDTVKQTDTGLMYIVVNESKLNSADGYMEYTAGTATNAAKAQEAVHATSATNVDWTGVKNIPSLIKDIPSNGITQFLSVDGEGNTIISLVTDTSRNPKISYLRKGDRATSVSIEDIKHTVESNGNISLTYNDLLADLTETEAAGTEIKYNLFLVSPSNTSSPTTTYLYIQSYTPGKSSATTQLRIGSEGTLEKRTINNGKWSDWVNLLPTALSNSEIDAAIAAAK